MPDCDKSILDIAELIEHFDLTKLAPGVRWTSNKNVRLAFGQMVYWVIGSGVLAKALVIAITYSLLAGYIIAETQISYLEWCAWCGLAWQLRLFYYCLKPVPSDSAVAQDQKLHSRALFVGFAAQHRNLWF